MACVQTLLQRATRTKDLYSITADTTLHRCLGIVDLTFLGIGSMVGSGIYVMTGIAAKEQAGPAIVVCFVLAAVIASLAAACFTELASRLHKTGSSYLYIYLTLGELPAFLVGFSILILIIMGGATNGRAWSSYLDSLFHGKIANYTETRIASWTVGDPIAEYPDFMAAVVILTLTAVVALGAQCSSKVNGIIVALNICVLLFVTIVGFVFADIKNWTSPDTGGFLPFGWTGLIGGTAACFWAFSGFEGITVAIEEAKNPKRTMPIGMTISLAITTLLYVGSSSALTMMTSYKQIDSEAPLPSAFKARGIVWAQYIVAVGPLCGLTSTLLNSLFGFGRMVFALTEDGLLFPFCGKVNKKTQVPVFGILLGGVMMSVVAIFLDLRQLIGFSVNFSLMQYCLVAAVVILLRYKPLDDYGTQLNQVIPGKTNDTMEINVGQRLEDINDTATAAAIEGECDLGESQEDKNKLLSLADSVNGEYLPLRTNGLQSNLVLSGTSQPGVLKPRCSWLAPCCGFKPGRWSKIALVLVTVCISLLLMVIVYGHEILHHWWTICLLGTLTLAVLVLTASFYAYQQNLNGIEVKIPCVPVLPILSMMTSLTLLIFNSKASNWIGTAILLAIALVFYFAYGIRHSKLNSIRFEQLSQETDDNVGLLEESSEEGF